MAKAKILKLTAALDAAKADAKAAGAAHKAEPSNRILRATYLGTLAVVVTAAKSIAKADPATRAKMTKVTEKYSQKSERLEESDHEDEEEEESIASGASSSEMSSEGKSSEEEEEAAASMPPSTAKSSEEEEEEEGAAEEEEEEAIAKAWTAAEKAYAKHAKGADAYGVFGPKGVRKALGKATGESSIKAALGALAALPRKAKADAKVVADVEKLKAKNLRADVEAIVQQAKAEGRAPSKDLRAELRDMGAKMGAKYLRGFVAKLPKVGRTLADGGRQPNIDGEGNVLGAPGAGDQEAMMARMTAGLDARGKAEFLAVYNEKTKALKNGAAGRA